MVPMIQGCIDERLKADILGAITSFCAANVGHYLCNSQFNQELRSLPRCDVYKVPKQTRRLSDYQKHLSVCMKDTAFPECVRKWKEGEKLDHLYQGTGTTNPGP